MNKLKRFIIDKYDGFLFFLEDICYTASTCINRHRRKLDKEYLNEYLQPPTKPLEEKSKEGGEDEL